MIASVIAAALLLASPTAGQRKALTSCLEKFTVKSVEDKMDANAFQSALAAACAQEEATLRRAALAVDLKAGRKAADSESMISGDLEDYKANAIDLFRDFTKSNPAPQQAQAQAQPQAQPASQPQP